jgi:hypothetical protein
VQFLIYRLKKRGNTKNVEEMRDFKYENFEEMHKLIRNNIEEMQKWYYT